MVFLEQNPHFVFMVLWPHDCIITNVGMSVGHMAIIVSHCRCSFRGWRGWVQERTNTSQRQGTETGKHVSMVRHVARGWNLSQVVFLVAIYPIGEAIRKIGRIGSVSWCFIYLPNLLSIELFINPWCLGGGFYFIFCFHFYLARWCNFTTIFFQLGWNHQLSILCRENELI